MNKNILYTLTLLSITTAPLHASDLENSLNELCKNHINFTNEYLSIALIGTAGVILTGIALTNLIARIYYPPKATIPAQKSSTDATTKFTKQLPQTTAKATKSGLNQTPTRPLADPVRIEYEDEMERQFFTLFD